MKLNLLRRHIDAIDTRMLDLLSERAKNVMRITALKKSNNIASFSPEREAHILRRLKALSVKHGVLSAADIEAVFSEVMSVCRGLHAALRIAYFGPSGTFTHLAAVKKFGHKPEYLPFDTIADVFDSVERGNADYGVVPVENSTEGVVNHTLDMFSTSNLQICSQVTIAVSQCLLSSGSVEQIKKVYSKPIVFAQCRKWLLANLPAATLVECSSTAKAAQLVRRDKRSACIGNKILADIYGLKVLRASIEDSAHNYTRFLVVGVSDSPISGQDKTSAILAIKDRVGALHDALDAFKKARINLTKIESRPSGEKPWEYRFFIDFEGHRLEPRIDKALEQLKRHCAFVKILGSYPA